MTISTVFGYSSTAASNTDVAGNGIQGSNNVSLGNDAIQNIMAQIASGIIARGSDIATASTLDFDAATTPSLTHNLTGTVTVTAVTLTSGQWRIARAVGAFQLTASSSLIVNGSTSSNYTTTAEDMLLFEGFAAGVVRVRTISSTASATTSTAGAVSLNYFGIAQNIGFTASIGSSALTVALKGADGNDPSATNPVIIPFRNVTAATGTPSFLTVTAATSIVISSGSTMGFTSGTIGRLWIVGFNDGGTFRLGLVNALSGTSIMALTDGIYSSTAEGGAGAADSAQVIYTGTAVTSKAMTILGYLEATEATAGTWATTPSTLQIRTPSTPLPGAMVQQVRTDTGTTANGTTVVPFDNTIPQNTEGVQFMTQAISPLSGANLLRVTALGNYSSSVGNDFTQSLYRDSTANALATSTMFVGTATNVSMIYTSTCTLAAATTSTTFKTRTGGSAAGTTYFNGTSSNQLYGGVMNSYMEVQEIMA